MDEETFKRLRGVPAGQAYAGRLARLMHETFSTHPGKLALEELRKQLFGRASLDRGLESSEQIIRRDAFRDVFAWMEGLVLAGAREEKETVL